MKLCLLGKTSDPVSDAKKIPHIYYKRPHSDESSLTFLGGESRHFKMTTKANTIEKRVDSCNTVPEGVSVCMRGPEKIIP